MRAPATALAGLILTGALAAALTGCAPVVPTPADSAVASSTAVDTPTPTPTATQISLSATQVLLEDADGSPLTTLTYTDDPANVLAQLTATFGSQPTQKPYDGGLDGPSGTDYGWDGFTFESLDIAKPTSAQERFSDPGEEGILVRDRGQCPRDLGRHAAHDAESQGGKTGRGLQRRRVLHPRFNQLPREQLLGPVPGLVDQG